MLTILRQFKKILFTALLVLSVACCFAQRKKAQAKPAPKALTKPSALATSPLKEFTTRANEANVKFTMPAGFKEVKALNNDYFSFDYGIALPGEDFEIWFQVKSLRENWASYQRLKDVPGKQLANPDSNYLEIGRAHAIALSGSRTDFFVRNLAPYVLQDYNADGGKTYLLNLPDSPETKHYRYALLITLQKDHTGIILAVALTNEKGPQFFRNVNKARNCIQFK